MIGRTNVGGGGGQTWSIRGWCETVGLSYGLLDDITEADMRTLMTKYASVAYFREWYASEPSMIDQFISNAYAMKWIGLRDYICDKLMAVADFKTKALASANWEYILKDHVPIMTSDTAPYGEVSASGEYSTYLAWKAFDADDATRWMPSNAVVTNQWIQYTFTNPICIKKVFIKSSVADRLHNFKILASNDNFGNDSHELYSGTNTNTTLSIDISNDNYYRTYRLLIIDSNHSAVSGCDTLQFYGRSLNIGVPRMTSATAPYGEVLTGTYVVADAYKPYVYPFSSEGALPISQSGTQWIGFKFTRPAVIKSVLAYLEWSSGTLTLEGSNNGSSWVTIGTVSLSAQLGVYYFNNETLYTHYRIIPVRSGSGTMKIMGLKFFGVDYTERTDIKFLYDHGILFETISVSGWVYSTNTVLDAIQESNQIYLSSGSATTQCYLYATSQKINLNQYNFIHAVSGDKMLYSQNGTAQLLISDVKDILSPIASYLAGEQQMAYGLTLDISSVNTSYYVAIRTGLGRAYSFTELWLE